MSDTNTLLKRLRGRGLSQLEIQRRTGIPQPRLSRWETKGVPDAADDALRLAALEAELQAGDDLKAPDFIGAAVAVLNHAA